MASLNATCNAVEEVVEQHHVYGAESIIRAIVWAGDGPYLDEAELISIVHDAYKARERDEKDID